ncbi:hypothetical protein ECDEC5B_5674 [Escherichia coli DEC5B]|nr:hypothetical protein ECDEC5B_5674 [Escherichia coli DEC5B]
MSGRLGTSYIQRETAIKTSALKNPLPDSLGYACLVIFSKHI